MAKKRKPKRKPKKKPMVVYKRKKRSGRDFYWNYFFLHNLFSMLIFFLFSVSYDLYQLTATSLGDVLQFSFLEFVGGVFFLSVIASLIARFIAWGSLYLIYDSFLKRTPVNLWEAQRSEINKMDLQWAVRTVLTAIAFSLSFYTLLNYAIFEQNSILTFILSYIIVQSVIWFLVFVKYK